MYTYRLVLIALCAQIVQSAPGVFNRIVVFPVDYSTWDTYDSAGCAGVPSNTSSTLVGRCADIDLYSVKLTPHPPPSATCVATFWNTSGCQGAQSADTNLENAVESSCMMPQWQGSSHGMFPEETMAKSMTVECEFH